MRSWSLLILILLYRFSSSAQNTIGLPKIINYSKSDFQAGTQTWDIKQDSRGMMYFANNEGMLTYDGSHWKLYPLPNKTIVRALAVDEADRVYVGAQNEMGYFAAGPNGNLQYTSLRNLLPEQQNRFADIWRIEVSGESVFFQASDRIFEYRNNSIKTHTPATEWIFLKKVGQRLYAQDKGSGLMEFMNNGWFPLMQRNPLKETIISGIIPVGGDSVILTTLCNGMYVLHNDTVLQRLPGGESCVYAATRINPSEFAAGTPSGGCLIMNFNAGVVQTISRTEGLQNNNVLCVFLDKDRNLWAGLKNGISFIAYNAAIKYISPSKTNEVTGYSTRIFNNRLYIATSDGAYAAPLPGTGGDLSFAKGDFVHIANSYGEVWRLDEINRQLLMGQHSGTFSIQGYISSPISPGAGAWLFAPTSSVFPAGSILTGTYNGVQLLDYVNGHFSLRQHLQGLQESIRFLAIDNDNTIWASHPYRGVYRLQLAADQRSILPELFTENAGLPSALGNYVFKIRNRVVFCTTAGVFEYDKAARRFTPSAFLAPVFGKMEIRYLHEDAEGNIWFVSGKKPGVVTFGKGEPYITYFPELDGQILLGFENIYPFNKENIFIGSEKGMIHLNYQKYTANKPEVKVLLGQVKAFGRSDSTIFGGFFSQPGAGQQEQDVPELTKSYNSFHFEYSTPSYGLQNNIEYSYQLEGYDGRWSAWSARTEKDYTNLPEGKYTFRVKAHDNLGNESAAIAYSFIVKPAWYKTIWAYIGYALLFMLLLYLLYRLQKRNLRRQQQRFDEEQRRLKYIHQLELEKSEKEIIALQNEKLASEITFKNKALADASLHLVERSDVLVKVKDILEKTGQAGDIKNAILLLNDAEKNDKNWEQFAAHFDEINNNFLKKLKHNYPSLTNTDLKVCAYLQLQLSSKEIAQLMAISLRGVEIRRYRLRKKLQLPTEQTLTDFLRAV